MSKKVYAIVSYDLLEYSPSMFVHKVYASKEKAEENLPEDDEYSDYEIQEWKVIE